MSCLYACAYVWAGVCGCVWLRLIRSSWESSPLGYISSCHALPLVRSLQFAVDVTRRFWFLVSAIPEPCCFPGLRSPETRLPIASLRYPPQPLRKAPFLPTESSVSAYGKLRFCLRKAPRLPTEAPPLCLRKAPFSFSLCITSCNKLSFSATESSRLHCDRHIYHCSRSFFVNLVHVIPQKSVFLINHSFSGNATILNHLSQCQLHLQPICNLESV